MKESTINIKLQALRAFHKCMIYNPLNYENHEKERIYYDLLYNAIANGERVHVGYSKRHNGYVISINGYIVER